MNRRYCNGMVHVIQPGETLYQLSRKYRVPLALLLRANPYVDVYNLQAGQEICIPMVRPNGMICVPAQDFAPQNNSTQESRVQENRMYEGEGEGADVQQNGTNPETGEEVPCCQEETVPIQQMNEDEEEEDDVEIYITSGGRSLGDILNEYGVNWEEFVKNNNLSQIVLGDDVVLYFPKRNRN